jgi:competence protein ComEA
MNQWLEDHKIPVFIAVGLLIAAAAAFFALRWRAPAPVVIEPPPATATSGPIQVYVSGAVAKPDVYSLPYGSIVKDALEAAGGATGDADLNHVNLAQSLKNNQQVYVPKIGEVPTPAPTNAKGTPGTVVTGPININTATQAELETLPHIGPAIAARIIDYRTKHGSFARIEDIKNVQGIGPSTFDQIKDLITVQ